MNDKKLNSLDNSLVNSLGNSLVNNNLYTQSTRDVEEPTDA